MSQYADDLARLYHRAFKLYRENALFNLHHYEHPTPKQTIAIIIPLRAYAGVDGQALANRIEDLYRLITIKQRDS